jgi:hypothetical protein
MPRLASYAPVRLPFTQRQSAVKHSVTHDLYMRLLCQQVILKFAILMAASLTSSRVSKEE